ncbi:MAG: PEGA domain-containing protein [Candidatus Atribacteria bacterium]
MLKSIFFLKKRKILTCILATLVLSLCLTVIGVNFAQGPEEIEKMKGIQIINPHPTFSLRLWLDKERGAIYAPGERIKIFFQASRDSYINIYKYDTEGRVKIIFPNQYSPHNFVRAGEVHSIEGLINPRTRPGIEYVQGFAITRPILLSEREKNLISKEFMPEVSKEYRSFTNKIKKIIQPLPPTVWTSSNIISYVVRTIAPPTYYGRIIALSNPQGAKVYLDNIYRGLTPLNLDRVTSGQHWIKFVMSGYQEWSSYISVSPYRTTTISANLIPKPSYGSISISCNQSRAKIFLDGTYEKRTSLTKPVVLKNVKEGFHELTVIKDGFRTWVEDVWVYTGETVSIHVTMTKL